jgi:hypothetical protein
LISVSKFIIFTVYNASFILSVIISGFHQPFLKCLTISPKLIKSLIKYERLSLSQALELKQ